MNDLIVSGNGEVEQALREIRGIRSASTVGKMRRAAERYQAWAATRPEESMVVRLESFGSYLLDSGLKPQSVAAAISPLKTLIRQLAKAEGNPAVWRDVNASLEMVELPKVTRGERLPMWLTNRQVRALLKGATGRDRLVLLLQVGMGLRRAEVAAVEPGQFERRDDHTILTIRNKGRIRSIPVPAVILRALEANAFTVGISPRAVYDVVRKHGRRIGVPGLKPHDCRRSFARNFHDGGGDLIDLQAILGHSSIATTQAYIGLGYNLERMDSSKYLPYLNGKDRDDGQESSDLHQDFKSAAGGAR